MVGVFAEDGVSFDADGDSFGDMFAWCDGECVELDDEEAMPLYMDDDYDAGELMY